MPNFPQLSRLLKGGIVLIDGGIRAVQRIIVFCRCRVLAKEATRPQVLRPKAPPVEMIKQD